MWSSKRDSAISPTSRRKITHMSISSQKKSSHLKTHYFKESLYARFRTYKSNIKAFLETANSIHSSNKKIEKNALKTKKTLRYYETALSFKYHIMNTF